MKSEVKELPEFNVVFIRKIGSYIFTCRQAFEELMKWAIPRNYVGPKKVLGIYWDNPEVTPVDKCRFDACIIVPDGFTVDDNLQTQKLWGGTYAVCNFELKPEEMSKAYEKSFAWVCESGYEFKDKPCFELYHNNAAEHPEGKWIFDICIPLKR